MDAKQRLRGVGAATAAVALVLASCTSAAAGFHMPFSGGARALLQDINGTPGTYGGAEPILYNFDGFEFMEAAPLLESTVKNTIPIDREIGYATGPVNPGSDDPIAYYITEGTYFALVVVTEEGVVLVDAPPSMQAFIVPALKDIAGEDVKLTHLVYSHIHQDHISGAGTVLAAFPDAEVVAAAVNAAVLKKRADLNRPLVTMEFSGNFTLSVGGVDIELIEAPPAHTAGDTFVFVPAEKVVVVVDVVFPSWTPFRSLALAEDFSLLVPFHDELLALDADFFVCGHLSQIGSRADVEISKEFLIDLRTAAAEALALVDLTAVAPEALASGNIWLVASELGRTWADVCYGLLKDKWLKLVSGFDVFGRSHCLVAVDFVRIE